MPEALIFLAGGLLYGAAQFFITSRVTESVLSSDVLRAGLVIFGKLVLYAAMFLFVWFYRGMGRIWFLGGYGAGICVPAIIYAAVNIKRNGGNDGGNCGDN